MRQIVRLTETLPDDFDLLRIEAAAEGYAFFDALLQEWQTGVYAGADERHVLFALLLDGDVAAVGAITPDPYDPAPDIVRVRHVYVRPRLRRDGIGRVLAGALIEQGLALAPRLSLRAADERAARFWDALGFVREPDATTRTHLLTR